jgi:multiple sugar transport system substrate-binding protein
MQRDTFRIAVRRFGPFESAIRKQWDAFEQAAGTGLQLDAVAMDLHLLYDALFESEGLIRGDWDVALINTDWVASANEKHCLLDLSPMLRSKPPAGYPEAWPRSLLRLQDIDGRVLGLPYHDGPECMIYRTDLLEDPREQADFLARYGTRLRVPETWTEFRQIARHFHRPAQGLYGTVYAAYPDGHNTVYDFCLQVWTRGGELTDAQGNLCLDTPQAREALQFLREIVNDGTAVHPSCRDMDSVKSGLAFAAGEAALMVNWFGFASMAETIAESRVKGRVGVGEIPHEAGSRGASLNIYWILSIGAGSRQQEIAWRFLQHCASAEMDKLLTLEGAIGCRKSTWADEDVNRIIPFYRRMDLLHNGARELPRMPEWPEVSEVIDRMVLQAINTAEPIEAIARQAQNELIQVLG